MESNTPTTWNGTYVNSGIAFAIGFFFSFRLAITILSMRFFGAAPQVGSAIRLGFSAFFFGVVCFCSFGATIHGLKELLRPSSVRWALLFLVFSGCSLLWSEAASIPASIAYWCGTSLDVVTVLLLLRTGEVEEVAVSIMKGYIWAACCIALIAWLMPTQYDLRLGDEDFFNANSICNVCAFAVFFAQYLMRSKRIKFGLITLFLILTILRSLSKATIAAFLISEIYLVIQDRSMGRKQKLLLTTAAILVVFIFWGLFEAYYDFYTSNGNQAETLTGRTAIWSYVLDAMMEHPWIGHGFDSMWNVVPIFGTFEARHAENELLEQLYSYGAAGVVLLCGIYGSLYRNIRRMKQDSFRVIFTSLMVFVVVRGFAEADPFDLLLPIWAVVLIGLLVSKNSERVTAPISSDLSINFIAQSRQAEALQ